MEASFAFNIPRPHLPLVKTTLIERLIRSLTDAGCQSCVICANRASFDRGRQRNQVAGGRVIVFEDALPRGTAGCIKDAHRRLTARSLFVSSGSLWLDDDPTILVRKHEDSGNAISIFCVDEPFHSNGARWFKPSGVVILDRSVLDFIPSTGYCDLKEQLMPNVRKAGLKVGAMFLDGDTHEVATWSCYLRALEKHLLVYDAQGTGYRALAPDIWTGDHVSISPTARIVGPALIGNGCIIEENALVLGPVVLADDTRVGKSALLARVVTTYGYAFAPGVHVTDRLIANPATELEPEHALAHRDPSRSDAATSSCLTPLSAPTLTNSEAGSRHSLRLAASGLLLLGAFVAAFWNTLSELVGIYSVNEEASAGALVPFACAYMVAVNRHRLPPLRRTLYTPGVCLFGLGLLMNLAGTYYLYSSIANVGMVTCALGIVMGLLGWRGFRTIWYPMLFLYLLCPPPNRLLEAVMLPLQEMGAALSGGILELVGIASERTGHVLEVSGHAVAVADACSGLRMVTSSVIVAGVLAYLVRAASWQRVTLLLSSLPIALACNVVRITVTAALIVAGYKTLAEGIFHSLTGLLMMPIMLALLVLELAVLRRMSALNPSKSEQPVASAVVSAGSS